MWCNKSWGKQIGADCRYNPWYTECPHCNTRHELGEIPGLIVGYQENAPRFSMKPDSTGGAVILECSTCFGTFWFHPGVDWAEAIDHEVSPKIP